MKPPPASNSPANQPPVSTASRVVGLFFYAFIFGASVCLVAVSAAIAWAGVYGLGWVSGDNRMVTAIGGAIIALIAGGFTVPVGSAFMGLFVTKEYDGKANPMLATLGAIFLPLLSAFVSWFPLFPTWLGGPIICGLICYNMPPESAALYAALAAPGAGIAGGALVVADIFGDSNG